MSDKRAAVQSVVILAVLSALLGLASPHFLTADNLLNVAQQSAINALLGIGLTFVLISGGVDLSVGSVLALSGLVCADFLAKGYPPAVAVALGCLVGTACGVFNGLATTLAGIPPFISTLGMMLAARSLANMYSGSRPISGLPAGFRQLAGTVGQIPVLLVVVLLFYLAAAFILHRTKLGRYTFAIGGNERAAWLSGVPIGRYKVALFALSGFIAGVCGVLMAARLNAASPLAGEMYELYAIAAAVIGGVSLMGGEGGLFGTLVGALIMGMLRNALNLLNVPSALEGVVVGCVLVIAVGVDRYRHKARPTTAATVSARSRWRVWIPALGIALLAVAGVAARQHDLAQQPAGVKVALVTKSMGSVFYVAMAEAAKAEALRQNVDFIALGAERQTDVERQVQIVENLLEQGVSALLLTPSGAKELVPVVVKANAAGVPVYILDSKLDSVVAQQMGAKTQAFIGSDNHRGGELAGEFLGDALGGRGDIAVIEGIPGHETAQARQDGFRQAIAHFPGVKIVASQAAHWERGRAHSVAENLLQAHPTLRGVFAANDEMALGALEALRAAGRPDIKVVGFDASDDALERVRSGELAATVAQFPAEMGRLGVLHAAAFVRGEATLKGDIATRVELVTGGGVGP